MSTLYPDARPLPGAGRYLFRALLFLVLLALLGAAFQKPLTAAFFSNQYLNGAIVIIFLFGVAYTIRALVETLGAARASARSASVALKARRAELSLTQANEALLDGSGDTSDLLRRVYRVIQHGDAATTLPYLLDSLATRHDDRRALVRYLVGALVLLGLIGTFYGLLLTIGGVREVISGLATDQTVDTLALIAGFKDRLAVPLGGMGTSFSASLFGLLGALALGFLELQLFHAQNGHHAQVEALVVSDLVPLWQPVVTINASTETISPHHLAALLQGTTDRLERVAAMTEYLANRGEGISRVAEQVAVLGERVELLRLTLQNLEQDRSADLRHELRIIAKILAENGAKHAAPPP